MSSDSNQCAPFSRFFLSFRASLSCTLHFIASILHSYSYSPLNLPLILYFYSLLVGVWEIACPALSMLARRQSCRKQFIALGGVEHVSGALTRLGTHCVLYCIVCCSMIYQCIEWNVIRSHTRIEVSRPCHVILQCCTLSHLSYPDIN